MSEHRFIRVHTPTPNGHGLGAHRSPLDPRDRKATLPPPQQRPKLPPMVDLSHFVPGIYDQGQLGSCTANAMSLQYRTMLAILGLPDFAPSRLALYYMERDLEHDTADDAGAYPRDGYKVMNKTGLASEDDWPYDVGQFAVKPSDQAYKDAATHEIGSYAAIDRTLAAMKTALFNRRPFTLGIQVYASFESSAADRTGVIPMPDKLHERLLGGHDILVVRYDDAKRLIKFANSWSDVWGDHGFGYLPYGYVVDAKLSFDRWKIELPA